MNNILLPLVLVGLMMYLLVIRPQRKVKAKRAELMAALSEGDEIVTIGGLYGRVADVADDTVDVEIAEGIIVRFDRRAVASITNDVPAPDDEDDAEDDVDEDPEADSEPDAEIDDHHHVEDPEEAAPASGAVEGAGNEAPTASDPASETTR